MPWENNLHIPIHSCKLSRYQCLYVNFTRMTLPYWCALLLGPLVLEAEFQLQIALLKGIDWHSSPTELISKGSPSNRQQAVLGSCDVSILFFNFKQLILFNIIEQFSVYKKIEDIMQRVLITSFACCIQFFLLLYQFGNNLLQFIGSFVTPNEPTFILIINQSSQLSHLSFVFSLHLLLMQDSNQITLVIRPLQALLGYGNFSDFSFFKYC